MTPFMNLMTRDGRPTVWMMISPHELFIGFVNDARDEVLEEYVVEVREDSLARLGLVCISLGFFTATAMQAAMDAVKADVSVDTHDDEQARRAHEALITTRRAISIQGG